MVRALDSKCTYDVVFHDTVLMMMRGISEAMSMSAMQLNTGPLLRKVTDGIHVPLMETVEDTRIVVTEELRW